MKIPCEECLVLSKCKNITIITFFSKILPSCSLIRDYLDIIHYTNSMCYQGININKEESTKRFKEAERIFKIKFVGA